MPQVILPTLREGETIEQKILYLTDNIYKLRKELSFLLGNLDGDNVIEARSVTADWIYAGGVSANQITAGTITAQINIISPNISGGTITGALYKTTNINNNRIEISGEGFYGYDANNFRHGPCINSATFSNNYSELTYYHNGTIQGSLNYSADIDTMQLYALGKLSILTTQGANFFGSVSFSGATVTLPGFAKQSDVSDAIASHIAAWHSGP